MHESGVRSGRQRWNTVRQDDIYQATYGLYSELEFKPVSWFRVIPGLSERVIYRELFPSGLTMLDSKEFGGMGLDYSYAMVMAEELGHINCGSVPMAVG